MADPMTMSVLMDNPLFQWLAKNTGLLAATNLLQGESPYERATTQMLGIGGQLIPQLQQQAAGAPTPATRAQNRQLDQAVNRMQQSYGASATRAGMAGPVGRGGQQPATIAQQGRMQTAKLGAMGDIMGQSSANATNLLAGMYQTGYASQGLLEAEQRQARGETFSNMATELNDYQQAKARGQVDAEEQELLTMIKEMLMNAVQQDKLLEGGGK